MKKYTKKRHRFFFSFFRFVGIFCAKIFHFKYKPIKLKKDEHYLIFSNHQTVLDPMFLCMQFKAPLYIVASDTLFNNSLKSKFLQFCFAPIKKRKALVDVSCIMACKRIANEGGNILMFPEGNRSWVDTPLYIDPSVCKLIRLLNMPLMLYNLSGGYGVNPRWGHKIRRGSFTGKINKIISVEQINALSDDQLYKVICESLAVQDQVNGNRYTCKKSAEHLENLFFVCPKCGKTQTLYSKNQFIKCSNCGFSAKYTSNLVLEGENLPFTKLSHWYNHQLTYLKNYKIEPNKTIFFDEKVKLYDKTTIKRKFITKGSLRLTDKSLTINNQSIDVKDIVSATVIGDIKLVVNTLDRSYFIKGAKRFNAIKYVLTFNLLSDKINDLYYNLDLPL